MRTMVGLFAALLSTAAAARPASDLDIAQTRGVRANSPLLLQLTEARSLGGDRLLMTSKLWSSTRWPVLVAIPTGHAEWRLQGAGGDAVQGGRP